MRGSRPPESPAMSGDCAGIRRIVAGICAKICAPTVREKLLACVAAAVVGWVLLALWVPWLRPVLPLALAGGWILGRLFSAP